MLMLAVTLAVLLGAPAAAVDDVAGWQTLRWGMTETEARQALEAAGHTLEPDSGRYRATYAPFATRLAIGGRDYQVTFQFADDTRRLIQVALRARTAPHPAGGPYRDMLDRLREQYGPPHSTARRPRPTAVWTFPSTTITLHGPVSSADMTTLYEVALIYRPSQDPGRRGNMRRPAPVVDGTPGFG
jgi:hypothetical protein